MASLPHKGSWLGLPDFGITEKVGDLMGKPRNVQGGSTLLANGSSALNNTQPLSGAGSKGSIAGVNQSLVSNQPMGPQLPTGFYPQKPSNNQPTTNAVPTGGGLSTATNAVNNAAQTENQSINSLSDAEIQALNDQLSSAGLSRDNQLQTINDQQTQVDSAKTAQIQEANDRAVEEISQGSAAARSAQQKVRNMLRGLGILASSAAGELLSQPINEFTQQKAQINQALTKRLGEIDTWYNTQVNTLAAAKRDIETQYSTLINNIKSDIRFTETERASALQQAKTQLEAKMLEIKSSLSNTQNDVMSTLQELMKYQDPEMNTNAINNAWMSAAGDQTTGKPQTASIVQSSLTADSLLGLGNKKNQGLSNY